MGDKFLPFQEKAAADAWLDRNLQAGLDRGLLHRRLAHRIEPADVTNVVRELDARLREAWKKDQLTEAQVHYLAQQHLGFRWPPFVHIDGPVRRTYDDYNLRDYGGDDFRAYARRMLEAQIVEYPTTSESGGSGGSRDTQPSTEDTPPSTAPSGDGTPQSSAELRADAPARDDSLPLARDRRAAEIFYTHIVEEAVLAELKEYEAEQDPEEPIRPITRADTDAQWAFLRRVNARLNDRIGRAIAERRPPLPILHYMARTHMGYERPEGQWARRPDDFTYRNTAFGGDEHIQRVRDVIHALQADDSASSSVPASSVDLIRSQSPSLSLPSGSVDLIHPTPSPAAAPAPLGGDRLPSGSVDLITTPSPTTTPAAAPAPAPARVGTGAKKFRMDDLFRRGGAAKKVRAPRPRQLDPMALARDLMRMQNWRRALRAAQKRRANAAAEPREHYGREFAPPQSSTRGPGRTAERISTQLMDVEAVEKRDALLRRAVLAEERERASPRGRKRRKNRRYTRDDRERNAPDDDDDADDDDSDDDVPIVPRRAGVVAPPQQVEQVLGLPDPAGVVVDPDPGAHAVPADPVPGPVLDVAHPHTEDPPLEAEEELIDAHESQVLDVVRDALERQQEAAEIRRRWDDWVGEMAREGLDDDPHNPPLTPGEVATLRGPAPTRAELGYAPSDATLVVSEASPPMEPVDRTTAAYREIVMNLEERMVGVENQRDWAFREMEEAMRQRAAVNAAERRVLDGRIAGLEQALKGLQYDRDRLQDLLINRAGVHADIMGNTWIPQWDQEHAATEAHLQLLHPAQRHPALPAPAPRLALTAPAAGPLVVHDSVSSASQEGTLVVRSPSVASQATTVVLASQPSVLGSLTPGSLPPPPGDLLRQGPLPAAAKLPALPAPAAGAVVVADPQRKAPPSSQVIDVDAPVRNVIYLDGPGSSAETVHSSPSVETVHSSPSVVTVHSSPSTQGSTPAPAAKPAVDPLQQHREALAARFAGEPADRKPPPKAKAAAVAKTAAPSATPAPATSVPVYTATPYTPPLLATPDVFARMPDSLRSVSASGSGSSGSLHLIATDSSSGSLHLIVSDPEDDRGAVGAAAQVAGDILHPGLARRERIFAPLRRAVGAIRLQPNRLRDYLQDGHGTFDEIPERPGRPPLRVQFNSQREEYSAPQFTPSPTEDSWERDLWTESDDDVQEITARPYRKSGRFKGLHRKRENSRRRRFVQELRRRKHHRKHHHDVDDDTSDSDSD